MKSYDLHYRVPLTMHGELVADAIPVRVSFRNDVITDISTLNPVPVWNRGVRMVRMVRRSLLDRHDPVALSLIAAARAAVAEGAPCAAE